MFGEKGSRIWGESRHGKEKREQSVVLMCQEAGGVTQQLSSRYSSVCDMLLISLQENAFVLVNELLPVS